MQVHSAGADDEFGPGFELVEAVEYWEPPIEGLGAPENPVPAPDGTLYQSPADANGNAAPADNGFMVSSSSGCMAQQQCPAQEESQIARA